MTTLPTWIKVTISLDEQAVVLDFTTDQPVMKGDVPDCWVSRVLSESLEIRSGPIYGIGQEHLAEQVLKYVVVNALNEFKKSGCFNPQDTTKDEGV